MKTYAVTVMVEVDETCVNAPDLEALKLAVHEAVNTPDNEAYGIHRIAIDGDEVGNVTW